LLFEKVEMGEAMRIIECVNHVNTEYIDIKSAGCSCSLSQRIFLALFDVQYTGLFRIGWVMAKESKIAAFEFSLTVEHT
jgi:hypothetical protein